MPRNSDNGATREYGSGSSTMILRGNVGRDAELKFTKAGQAYTKFSVAVSHMDGDEKITNWYNVTYWGHKAGDDYNNKIAERMANVRKGDLYMAEGDLQPRPWEDKNGVEHLGLDFKPHFLKTHSVHPEDRPFSDESDSAPARPAKRRRAAATAEWDDDDGAI